MSARQILTHSRMACFRACPRRHYLRYELGLLSQRDSTPRKIGSAFARAVEADAKGLDVQAAIGEGLRDDYDLAMVAAMFDGHRRRWLSDQLEHVAAELPFELDLVNPATGSASTTWRMAGVIDRIVRLRDGRLALMEYKSTSLDFAPGADYWVKLHMDRQLSIYVIAARALGFDVATVLYDVTRRPALRPLRATPPEKRTYRKDGALYANQREHDESPEGFAARIAEDITERPDHYFARIEIARLDQDLEDCQAELWQQQRSMREAQLAGRWYRNPEACFGQTFTCDYLPICQRRDLETTTPDGFDRVEDIHTELTRHATSGGHPAHARSGPADQEWSE